MAGLSPEHFQYDLSCSMTNFADALDQGHVEQNLHIGFMGWLQGELIHDVQTMSEKVVQFKALRA